MKFQSQILQLRSIDATNTTTTITVSSTSFPVGLNWLYNHNYHKSLDKDNPKLAMSNNNHNNNSQSFQLEPENQNDETTSIITLPSDQEDGDEQDVSQPGINLKLYELATHISSHSEINLDKNVIHTAPPTPPNMYHEDSADLRALTSPKLKLNQTNGTDDSLDIIPQLSNKLQSSVIIDEQSIAPEVQRSPRQEQQGKQQRKEEDPDWELKGNAKLVKTVKTADGQDEEQILIKKNVKDFKFGKTLGVGSYSNVILATDKTTNRNFAVKVLDKRHIIREKKVKYVNIEKNTLNRLGKRNGIIHLFFTFQDEASLYFVLDYAENGELLSLIKKYGSLNEETTRFYGAQILDAVKYMHDNGVVHRDLKPENILLNSKMQLQITDFGTAKLLEKDEVSGLYPADTKARSFVGTAEYVSPELLNEKAIGKPCDIWAFGCIIYQMIAGKPPFKATNEYLTFQKIIKLQYAFTAGFPMSVRDLIKRILVRNPDDRITIKEIQNHHFFQSINFNNQHEIWDSALPEIGPYKINAKSMLPIPGLDTSVKQKITINLPPKRVASSPSVIQTNSNSAPSTPMSNMDDSSTSLIEETEEPLSTSEQVLQKAKEKVAARKQQQQQQRNVSSVAAASFALSRPPNDILKAYNDKKEVAAAKAAASSNSNANTNGNGNATTTPKSSPALLQKPFNSSPNIKITPSQATQRKKPMTPSAGGKQTTTVTTTPMTKVDIEFANFLQNIDERIIKSGNVGVLVTTVDFLEKKYRGKLVDSPLGSNPLGSSSSSSLLHQVANGSMKGLRNLNDYQSNQGGNDGQVITNFDNESDSPVENENKRSKFKKFFTHNILLNQEQEKKSRILLATTEGRALILGRDPKTDSLELRTEINLLHPVIKVKELITDQQQTDPNSSSSNELSIFVIQSFNTAFLFETSKAEVSRWTKSLYKSRCCQVERNAAKRIENDPSGDAGTLLGSDAAKSAAHLATISSPTTSLKSPINLSIDTFQTTSSSGNPSNKSSPAEVKKHESAFSGMLRAKELEHRLRKKERTSESNSNSQLLNGLPSRGNNPVSSNSNNHKKVNPLVAAAEAAIRKTSSSNTSRSASSGASSSGTPPSSSNASLEGPPKVVTGMNSRLLARSHRKR